MLICQVCGQENDDLAVVCSSCKGYLQTKVDTLDLFRTIWGLVEAPTATMHRIAIARHKNYVITLSALFGIALAYGILWFRYLGNLLGGLAPALVAGFLTGPILGILVVLLLTLFLRVISRTVGGHSTTRQTFSVLAYATVPIVLSLVFVFPVEIAVFGGYLFEGNPSPLVINPVAYVALLVIDGIMIFWALILLWIGIRVAHRLSKPRAFLVALSVPVLTAAAAFGLLTVR